MTVSSTIVLSGAQLEGLELILSGLLPEAARYRLPGGASAPQQPSPAPKLVIPESSMRQARVGDEVTLCDPENTPIAVLAIEELLPLDRGRIAVTGGLRQLRSLEHGPARGFRLEPGLDLSHSTVAVFSPGVSPADILRAVRTAAGSPLELIAEGTEDRVASARLVRELQEAAELIPHAHVRFVPCVDLGDDAVDATMSALAEIGAVRPLDLRGLHSGPGGGAVVLFTGLSGAGKSTVARALTEWITGRTLQRAVLLDGDELRRELASDLGFSPEDRHRNLERQAWVAARVAEAGGLAICAPIAPFAASRAAMRAKVEPRSRFIVIHVATPLAVAEARDRKGLYAQARAGVITDFTGIDSPYETPDDADLSIDTSELTVDECVAAVTALLSKAGLLGETA